MATTLPTDNPSASDRFQQAAQHVRDSHGGRPTASIEDGRIVFTYPDGTKTSGGQRVS